MPGTTESSSTATRWTAETRSGHGGRSRRRGAAGAHEEPVPHAGGEQGAERNRRAAGLPTGAPAGMPGGIGVPALPPGFVHRGRLTSRMVSEQEARIVLITAPAGFGKTALLSDWAGCDERAFAWVTLGSEHNDPSAALASIAAALEHLDPASRRRKRPAPPSASGATLADLTREVERLLGEVAGTRSGGVLVLDDLQAVRRRDALSVVAYLASAMPERFTLAIASRRRPALPLARLRARHGLLELGAGELAATAAEAAEMLEATSGEHGHAWPPEPVGRTEGWPAALSLLAESRREAAEELDDAECSAAHERLIADYVREEVLAGISPAERDFLVSASLLEVLSADLCDAALARADSGAMLRAAAANLLVAPVAARDTRAGASYRCHPLLRAALQDELAMSGVELTDGLHRRASGWLEARGEIDGAIEHAVACRDSKRAGELLGEHAARLLMQGRASQLLGWLARLTERDVRSRPELALCAAHAWLEAGDLDRAQHWARAAASALEAEAQGTRIAARSRSLLAGIGLVDALACRHGLEAAGEEARSAYRLDADDGHWRAHACLVLGVVRHLAGADDEARAWLTEGASRSAVVTPLVESLCLAELAAMAAEVRDWQHAAGLAGAATARLDAAGLSEQPMAALVHATAAWAAAGDGRCDDATGSLRQSVRLLETLAEASPWYEVQARVMLAHASIRLADVCGARELLAQASHAARRMPDAPVLRVWLDEAWAAIDEAGAAALDRTGSLTMAELRILRFLPTHLSFREIGARLHVSTNTVKSQAHAVYSKLGAASRSEAVTLASELGLIDVLVT